MVLSRLLRLVLGLVIVVPKLACLECPRLNTAGNVTGEGLGCDPDEGVDALLLDTGVPRAAISFSKPSEIPFPAGIALGAGVMSGSDGVVGRELERMAFPSSESASKSSGGRRSFSISDFRLTNWVRSVNFH
jgi:hypothetical protein